MKTPKKPIKRPKTGEILGGPGEAFGNEKRKKEYQKLIAKAKTKTSKK